MFSIKSLFKPSRPATPVPMVAPANKWHSFSAFAKHAQEKYGISPEELKTGFNTGKFLGKSYQTFFEVYDSLDHFDEPYKAYEAMVETLIADNARDKAHKMAIKATQMVATIEAAIQVFKESIKPIVEDTSDAV